MKALCLLAVIFTTALPQSSSAQDVADPRQWIESVLSILVNVGEDAAIQRIKNESFIGKNNAAGFVKIKVLVSGQAKIAGPATGFEFISMENWGNSLDLLQKSVREIQFPQPIENKQFLIYRVLFLFNGLAFSTSCLPTFATGLMCCQANS